MTNPSRHVRVAIVGGGPAGIGAAVALSRRHVSPILLFERRTELGGIPARYKRKPGGVPTFFLSPAGPIVFGETFAERLRQKLVRTDVQVWLESQVTAIDAHARRLTVVGPALGQTEVTAEAVILACGARESTLAERNLLAGSRAGRVFFTKNLIDWVDRNDCLPANNPVVLGSDLIAFSAAAKLRAAGSAEPLLIDWPDRPACGLLERLYFRRWTQPLWRGGLHTVELAGQPQAQSVRLTETETASCDGVILSGGLVPNSELALTGGLEVELPSRLLIASRRGTLSQPGWFAAGGMLGGFHGAHWCYRNGLRLGKTIVRYLEVLDR